MAQNYEEKQASFARVRAQIMKLIHAKPGLTHEEIQKEFLTYYGFLPIIDNRLRELRQIGYAYSISVNERLRWYPKKEQTD